MRSHSGPKWYSFPNYSEYLLLSASRTRWVGRSLWGVIHLMTLCQADPINHRKVIWKFLITQLYRIHQLLHEFCKAPLESAVSDSCLACLPTPGPSVVPVNWLAVPGRSKKWGRGVLSVSPLLQTPAGFPWQLLVTPLIFCLPAGCRGGASFGWWVARSRRCRLFGKLFGDFLGKFVPEFHTRKLCVLYVEAEVMTPHRPVDRLL